MTRRDDEETHVTPLPTMPLKSWVSPSRKSSNPPPNLLQAALGGSRTGKEGRYSRYIAEEIESELIGGDEHTA